MRDSETSEGGIVDLKMDGACRRGLEEGSGQCRKQASVVSGVVRSTEIDG